MSRNKRALVVTLGVVVALVFVGSALAASSGKGGKGHDPTLAIATQQPGSVTFSVMVPDLKSGAPSIVVTVNCYDASSRLDFSSSLNVVWASSTVGYAGPFTPPSSQSCYAYAHSPGSDTVLPGGMFSFVAP
jgi:hypothetical protein